MDLGRRSEKQVCVWFFFFLFVGRHAHKIRAKGEQHMCVLVFNYVFKYGWCGGWDRSGGGRRDNQSGHRKRINRRESQPVSQTHAHCCWCVVSDSERERKRKRGRNSRNLVDVFVGFVVCCFVFISAAANVLKER